MSKRLELTGQKFNKLTVLEFSCVKHGNSHWLCECDCGTKKVINSNYLKNGTIKSCGCSTREYHFLDITGQKFGRLTVISFSHKGNSRQSFWLCRCECGKEKVIRGGDLKNGATQSCGCYNKELVSGENNVNWRDGSSKHKYPPEWTNELRESIRNRDNRNCQFPDCEYDDTKEKIKLSVHHIDGNKDNCEQYNLISLCINHHMEIERNPSLWIDYFYQITNDYQIA